jgi:hypothetical protein
MKKIVLVVLMIICGKIAFAQNMDEERMQRDLEVARNIISTLLQDGSEGYFVGGNAIDASYVDGYGVIFTIPRHYVYFNVKPAKAPKVGAIVVNPSSETVIIREKDADEVASNLSEKEKREQERMAREQERRAREQEHMAMEEEHIAREQESAARDLERAQREFHIQQNMTQEEIARIQEKAEKAAASAMEWQSNYSIEIQEQNENWEKAMITFLADYADLIGQLKPEEKIMIKRESPYEEFTIVWNDSESGEETAAGLSMEVSKKDISAYKTGKISLDDFKERISIKRKAPEKKLADLEMFSSIFKQYYSPKLSKTFFTDGNVTYEILDGYGVIYNIKTYSSYAEGKVYYMPVLGEEKVSSEERKKTIEELYPQFESDLKAFMVDYGRTIRSLEDDNVLLLKIRLTRCDDCSIPESIDASIKMSVLRQFDQQKITRDKALGAIEIKKNK